ncbi:MAG: FGGY-family carbohydrate kinase [Gammaproteobacteria bacterium]|jgi:glycerol kinase
MKSIICIDQGTTSSRVVAFNEELQPLKINQQEYSLIFPEDGWVEIDISVIEKTVNDALADVMRSFGDVISLGITNQRETTLLWNRVNGMPLYNAIVWQDRRTAKYCEELKSQGLEETIKNKTGLVLDPYFSATKIKWILDKYDSDRKLSSNGDILFGTVETFLIWKLTGGKDHFTDFTNASRTMICNIDTQDWDDELLTLFNIPREVLPKIKHNDAFFGEHQETQAPIHGAIGDQQAALVGQNCFEVNSMKATFGTGCFLMVNTGNQRIYSKNGLLTTAGYSLENTTAYALEGSIFSAGTGIKWLRDNLNFFENSSDSEKLINAKWDSGGVIFVPAFSGLGAPRWQPNIRAGFYGMTADSERSDLVTSVFKALCFQVKELIIALESDAVSIHNLSVDGGMTNNQSFCQMLADICNINIIVPDYKESTVLGAAKCAAIGSGVISMNDLKNSSGNFKALTPNKEEDYREEFSYWSEFINSISDSMK